MTKGLKNSVVAVVVVQAQMVQTRIVQKLATAVLERHHQSLAHLSHTGAVVAVAVIYTLGMMLEKGVLAVEVTVAAALVVVAVLQVKAAQIQAAVAVAAESAITARQVAPVL